MCDQNDNNAASQLISMLVESGSTMFFGIPGGPVSPVFDAILQNSKATLIESRQETAAVFAAVDYYRASGNVPVIVVTAGPGATNAITGITSAHLERIPMLIICGDVAWSQSGEKLLQDNGPEGINIEHMVSNITRAQVRASRPDTVVSQCITALNAATNSKYPGPALFVLPIQMGRVTTKQTITLFNKNEMDNYISDTIINQTIDHLKYATRPLLVLGNGCREWADEEISYLVNQLNIPFVTTPQAKGIISELHPLSLRNGGIAASNWARHYTSKGVDFCLVLGTDLDDCSVGPTPYISNGGKLIHVDLNPSVFGRNLPTTLGIVADVREFANKLTKELRWSKEIGWTFGKFPNSESLLSFKKEMSAFEVENYKDYNSDNIAPWRAVADLQAALPDAKFITDIGEHMLSALHYYTADRVDKFTIHLGLGSMGSGIAGSIGLALGSPDKQVVCICGDGGMQMIGMEVQTALKYKLPIVFAVFNDARYNMVYHGYKQVYGREAPWDSPAIDFNAWAASLGIIGYTITKPGEMTPKLINSLTCHKLPVILDIRIDRDLRLKGGGRNESLAHMSMSKGK